jgi:hypothetical protein
VRWRPKEDDEKEDEWLDPDVTGDGNPADHWRWESADRPAYDDVIWGISSRARLSLAKIG